MQTLFEKKLSVNNYSKALLAAILQGKVLTFPKVEARIN